MQKPVTYTAARETDPETGGLCLFARGCSYTRPHDHEYYEIFLTLSGTLNHIVNEVTQVLPEGSLVFVRPRDSHSFFSDNPAEVSYINLTFTLETAALLFEYLSDGFPAAKLLNAPMPPTALLTLSQKNKLYSEIDELNLVNWQDKKQLKLRLRVLLANIFSRYFTDIPDEKSEIPLWLVHLSEKMSVPENFTAGADRMIELSRKSREHLSRSIKKHYGLSLTEYINDLRLSYASNLLLKSNTSVLDICYDCGFGNVSYFYRTFKKKFGLTPLDFRKKYSKNMSD